MKTALITTTINVPCVLELYRKLGPDVRFFVAGDLKSPHDKINALLSSIGRTGDVEDACEQYWHPIDQAQWKCSELIGWNNDSRRNIALLEAVKWGAEIIVSVDDDMIPMEIGIFDEIEFRLTEAYSGLCLGEPNYWVDVGLLTQPQASQRGIPFRSVEKTSLGFVLDGQVGAMQGIILGVPDTDAVTMSAHRPVVLNVTDVLRAGFVVHPGAKSVFNSQFTAFRRELAPAFAQFYKWQGRNTDIFASLIMRRVMRERNLYTHFGSPMGFHARTYRDSLKDLKAEMWGLEHVVEFEEWLGTSVFMSDDKTTLDMTRRIWQGMPDSILPRENIDAALAFLDDMEGVL